MKKIFLTAFLSTLVITLILSVSVFSDGEVNYTETAPGGEISGIDDINTVFGNDNVSVVAEGEEVIITFKYSVKLLSPIIIKNGVYRINGMDCTVFRGFQDGSLIVLDGSSGNAPKLIIDEESQTDWETGNTAIFALDGNSSEFPSANGALLTVKGNGSIDFNGKVLFKNAVNTSFGGAIYAECVQNGSEVIYAPSVKLNNTMITECKSLKGGGGIALYGGKTGEGEITLTDVILHENKAINNDNSALGGGVYTHGGKITVSGNYKLTNNSGNLGGCAYISGFAEFNNGLIRDNSSNVSGGAIHCGMDKENGFSGSVTINNCMLSYNITEGNGGTIINEGTLLIGGNTYVTDSRANGDGGGIYNLGSFGFSGGDIITNKATGKAGAVYNGPNGIMIISGGRISSNEAKFCGGIYSEGTFEFKGGSIGKNIGAVPQNLVSGLMQMSGSATFTNTEVIGILITDGSEPTVINIEEKLTSRVIQTVAFFEKENDENGNLISLNLANKSGLRVFSGDTESLESAIERFKVQGHGLKNFKLSPDGTLSFKMPLMPLWGWLLTLVGIAGISVGSVFAVKKLKKHVYKNKSSKNSGENTNNSGENGNSENTVTETDGSSKNE